MTRTLLRLFRRRSCRGDRLRTLDEPSGSPGLETGASTCPAGDVTEYVTAVALPLHRAVAA